MSLKIGKNSGEGKAVRTACLNCNGRTTEPEDLLCEFCNIGRPPTAFDLANHSPNRNKARYMPRTNGRGYHYSDETKPITLPSVSILEGQL